MAGRIRDADILLVRDRSRIDEVVGEYVQLRPAGSGSLKGLCPFHEEKSPSFNVRPAVGAYYCFGCQKGGDVISFIREIDALTFQEAVERLARRAGVTLTYEGGGTTSRAVTSQRQRLLDAHRAAAEFYAEQLASLPEARAGWDFLAGRGFDAAAAGTFGVGYAPSGWDTLTKHLLARRFTGEELVAGGLAKQGGRGGLIDRFHRRLVWPIRERARGEVIGFGARKLAEDDPGPKYLNSPETVLFKKSTVLYGADLARREIARSQRVVIVEGYTDVMACHLAGEQSAVATCGTAFGTEHISMLRGLLMDSESQPGEVIFTFDSDAAGEKAAQRAFESDRFGMQTFMAVDPNGLDPCDLRQQRGDAALRDLIASRTPLYEFAIRGVVERHDLNTVEGRLAAIDAAAPIILGMKDHGRRLFYAAKLDRWTGFLDEDFVQRRVNEHLVRAEAGRGGKSGGAAGGGGGNGGGNGGGQQPDAARRPGRGAPGRDPSPTRLDERRRAGDDPAVLVEREVLKMALQYPGLAGTAFDALEAEVFTVPAHQRVRDTVTATGGVYSGLVAVGDVASWVGAVASAAPDEGVRQLVTALAVEPALCDHDVDDRYVDEQMSRVQELHVTRRIAEIKSRVQRLNPVTDLDAYNRAFSELIALEQYKRQLRERGVGAA